MASVLGNSSRASGAQGGQVKCKLKRRRRRRSKRKGTTLQHFCAFALSSLRSAGRGRAHLGEGALERAAAPVEVSDCETRRDDPGLDEPVGFK